VHAATSRRSGETRIDVAGCAPHWKSFPIGSLPSPVLLARKTKRRRLPEVRSTRASLAKLMSPNSPRPSSAQASPVLIHFDRRLRTTALVAISLFGTAAGEVGPYSRRKIASLVLHIRSRNFSQPPGVEALDSQFNPTCIWPYWFCLILLSFIFCWRGCSGPT
jgi:hypothetical protein